MNIDNAQTLPLYQCHKQVRAAKITRVQESAGTPPAADGTGGKWWLHLEDFDGDALGILTVDAAWYAKHSPQEGGYVIAYKDGYVSYSPAVPFEEGYTLVGSPAQIL